MAEIVEAPAALVGADLDVMMARLARVQPLQPIPAEVAAEADIMPAMEMGPLVDQVL
jgi:hypothetical protein